MKRRAIYTAAALAAVVLLLAAACSTGSPGSAGSAGPAGGQGPSPSEPAAAAAYLSEVEGLHVTGTPVAVDVETYRLQVTGKVARPLSLSLEEVRALPVSREEARLVCPGFFVDNGFWTGVPLRELLERAGVRPGARRVAFSSVDGSYAQSLPLEEATAPAVLIAYEFDDRPFPPVHGFPLRLVAPGHPGSVWVKWLGTITVLD